MEKKVLVQASKKEDSKQFVAKEEQKKGSKIPVAQSQLAAGKKSPRQYERKLSQGKTAVMATAYS